MRVRPFGRSLLQEIHGQPICQLCSTLQSRQPLPDLRPNVVASIPRAIDGGDKLPDSYAPKRWCTDFQIFEQAGYHVGVVPFDHEVCCVGKQRVILVGVDVGRCRTGLSHGKPHQVPVEGDAFRLQDIDGQFFWWGKGTRTRVSAFHKNCLASDPLAEDTRQIGGNGGSRPQESARAGRRKLYTPSS